MLAPGDRFWVNIPGKGYVGVGRHRLTPSHDRVEIDTDGGRQSALDVIAVAEAQEYGERAAEPYRPEYVVRVEWLDTSRRR